MSRASRELQVGAMVTTDFSGRITMHRIVERIEYVIGTSGIGFRVAPIVKGSTGDWIDADWFEPAPINSPSQEADDSQKGGAS